MRYAILADIHANLAALEAVLAELESRGGASHFWCLGDTIGYGPDPEACLERLLNLNHTGVAGNHDMAAIDKTATSKFNPLAAFAADWSKGQLESAGTGYLEALPLLFETGDFTLVHASPRDPIWEYLTRADLARANFSDFKTPYCLVGHSHVPLVFESDKGDVRLRELSDGYRLELTDKRLIINPGSVGQPRDGDSRASYAIYDEVEKMITFHRVPYDIKRTQSRMVAYHLPERLITRLDYGL